MGRNIRRFGRLGDLRIDRRNDCDEPVTRSGDCLHKLRQVGAVPKGLANFADCRVDSVFDVDEDFLLPQALSDLITGNDLAMPGDEEDEEFERFPLEFQPATFSAELKSPAVKAEVAELIDGKGHVLPPGRLKYSIHANRGKNSHLD